MYEPPFCPNESCPDHLSPGRAFYRRRGFYRRKCRPFRVQRLQCRSCSRTFSKRTFCADYRDHKPFLNERVAALLSSGAGLRQTAWAVGLTYNSLVAKARKIARVASLADENLQRAAALRESAWMPGVVRLQMDEFMTYETCRNSRPVSLATVIESRSRFLISSRVAAIRPSGAMSEQRARRIRSDAERFGPRPDESPKACADAFDAAARLFPKARAAIVETDERPTYPRYIAAAFEGLEVVHRTTPGTAPRGPGTPLFPINLTEAVMRDQMGRLRRRSWLVSKRREWLQLFVEMHCAVRNWVRPRFSFDDWSPAQFLGFAPRRLALGELLSWRQDWGGRSPSPFHRAGRPFTRLAVP